MKKKIIVVMATLLAFSASLALADIQPATTQSGISNGIYSCCGGGWGGGYPPYPPPRY